MKNLVTGGSGFLGSHLVEALVARKETVRALVRPTSQTAHLESLGVELVHGDLGDAQSLRTAVEGVEHIYHCAALASDWGTWEQFRATNVDGVRNLLEATVEADVSKFIHVSTTDVYGHPDHPADESAPTACGASLMATPRSKEKNWSGRTINSTDCRSRWCARSISMGRVRSRSC